MESLNEIYLNTVIGVSLLILISGGAYLLSMRIKNIPYMVLLMIIGMLISPLHITALDHLQITPGMILYIFLPLLLFESAFNFDAREFKRILTPGILLATAGLIVSALVIALGLHLIFNIGFIEAFLFGSVISSTDPIAVLTIFKKLGVPKRLQLLVDGESFLNDGTSVIMFRILLPLTAGIGAEVNMDAASLVFGMTNFVYVMVLGAIIGAIMGWVFSQIIARINNVSSVEILLTVVLASVTFIIADHFFMVSGIIAVLAAGLIMGNYGRDKISPKVIHNMHITWDLLVFISTSFVFLLMGYEVDMNSLFGNINIIAGGIVLLIVARSVSVYLIGGIYNFVAKSKHKIPWSWLHITNWGGLRGALPLVVLLSLPETFELKEVFIQITLGCILFTMLFNSITIKPLISKLGIDKLNSENELEVKITKLIILKGMLNHIRRLREIDEISDKVYKRKKDFYEKELVDLESELSESDQANPEKYDNEYFKIIRRFAFNIEAGVYRHLYYKNVIDENVYSKLKAISQAQLELMDECESIGEDIRCEKKFNDMIKKNWVGRLVENIETALGIELQSEVEMNYLAHKARLLGNEKVIEELEYFQKDKSSLIKEDITSLIKKQYEEFMVKNKKILAEIEAANPELCLEIEERLLNCESMDFIDRMLQEYREESRFSPKALQALMSNLQGGYMGK